MTRPLSSIRSAKIGCTRFFFLSVAATVDGPATTGLYGQLAHESTWVSLIAVVVVVAGGLGILLCLVEIKLDPAD